MSAPAIEALPSDPLLKVTHFSPGAHFGGPWRRQDGQIPGDHGPVAVEVDVAPAAEAVGPAVDPVP